MRLLVLLLLCTVPGWARGWASSCLGVSVCAAYSNAAIPLIFRGEVVEVTAQKLPPPLPSPWIGGVAGGGGGMDTVRFVVREALKGAPGPEITVSAPGGVYKVGREYLVYVGMNPAGDYSANACVRQQDMSRVNGKASDIELLRALAKTDGMGVIFGRLYMGGTNLGGEVAPLEGAEVTVAIDGAVKRETRTEPGSRELVYVMTGVPPGEYTVAAKAAAGVAVTRVDKAGGPVSVEANGCRDVDWFLRVDNHIRGRVTDSAGQPVAGADVGLIARGGREADLARGRFAAVTYLVTDADGRYDFAGVNPGDYSVVLHRYTPRPDDPYPPVFYPAAARPSDGKVLHLGSGETLDGIDMVRPEALRPATVHVAVARAVGTPIENAMVVVTDPASAVQVAATGRTDSNGRLVVQLLAGREYTITASTPDPNGQVQESPQCAGPVEFVATDGMDLARLVPDKTFQACRSAARPALPGGK